MLQFIKTVSQRPIKLEEAKRAKEVFMVGSATVVRLVGRHGQSRMVNQDCLKEGLK